MKFFEKLADTTTSDDIEVFPPKPKIENSSQKWNEEGANNQEEIKEEEFNRIPPSNINDSTEVNESTEVKRRQT